jgi:uncharacterized protein YbjT (DUF2867 family)
MASGSSALKVLVVGATGGLGQSLVQELLSRGHNVSVLVRNQAKLAETTIDAKRLSQVYVGDGADPKAVGDAVRGKDVVLSGSGANLPLASTVATQCKAEGVKKFVFVAGSTNVMEEDGVTPHYISWIPRYPAAESSFKAHGPCIEAIRASGSNYVVFCPSYMKNVGARSSPPPAIRINRPSGDFVSYEDAAWVMAQAAEVSDYDGQLITAATKQA